MSVNPVTGEPICDETTNAVARIARRVRQHEVSTRMRRVIVLAVDEAEAMRRAAPLVGNAPMTVRPFGPWSR